MEVLYKAHRPERRKDTGFAPIGLDEPYRVFISEDPIGLKGGIKFFTNPDIIGHPSSFETNLFLYTGNNPIKYTDPRGLDRYAPCEGHGCILKWLCKKVVIDKFVCGGAKEVACCEAEKADCMNKVDPNDPQYGEKLHACETLYQCEGKAR